MTTKQDGFIRRLELQAAPVPTLSWPIALSTAALVGLIALRRLRPV